MICLSNKAFFHKQVYLACHEQVYLPHLGNRKVCNFPFCSHPKKYKGVTFIYLQSIGKAVASTVISLIREIVLGVGFALLLPKFFGLDGILYSFPAADILTFVVALFVIVSTYKELSTDTSIRK